MAAGPGEGGLSPRARIGVDIGGTKIEAAVLDESGAELLRRRIATPHADYDSALEALTAHIIATEREAGRPCSVGIGLPGTVLPRNGVLINAYNTPYNERPIKRDLEARLGREVRFANDANCFALSETVDGAARGAGVVFGGILGTGVGGGIVVNGRALDGRHGIAGEWGHTPLPWMSAEEHPGPRCNCGRHGCIEQFLSGPAKNRERDVVGDEESMRRYENRLARALAMIINILDPDVIVLGGGVSKHQRLYQNVPPLLRNWVYFENADTPVVQAKHGDASGVRGAAMLWP